MSKNKTPTVVQDGGFRWNDDDFNLNSHGVEAPEDEVFEMLAEMGRTPEEVNEVVRERQVKYLEQVKKKTRRGADRG